MKLSELIKNLAEMISVQGNLEFPDKIKISVSKNKSICISKV